MLPPPSWLSATIAAAPMEEFVLSHRELGATCMVSMSLGLAVVSRRRFIPFVGAPTIVRPMGKTKANDGGKRSRRLVIIGGGVDKQGPVLHEVARYVNNGKLVIATVAAEDSAKSFETYKRAFSKLGLPPPAELSIYSHADPHVQ